MKRYLAIEALSLFAAAPNCSRRLLDRGHRAGNRNNAKRHFALEASSPSAAAPGPRRLPYEHAYHAGNYADVVKHGVLIRLLRRMQIKASPMAYVETHAGAGAYPLRSEQSRTLAEHEEGVRLLDRGASSTSREEEEAVRAESAAQTLLEIMERLSKEGDAPVYPGSPVVAASLCRDQDSLLLCEKERGPFERLRRTLGDDARVTLLHDDGYKALRCFDNLRSHQRALVFIDPPYQLGSDTDQIAALVGYLRRHWRAARVAIWHPMSRQNRDRADRLYREVGRAVAAAGGGSLLATEVYDDATSRVGTGMLLVEPPYGIDRDLRDLLPALGRALGDGESMRVRVEQL